MKIPTKIKSTILLILIALSTKATRQDSLFFLNIKVSDGLPGSTVTALVQDHLGFIWIGTNDGLCRYDGANFKVYRHEVNNPQSISHNFIHKLKLDKHGNLWVITAVGLDYFNLKRKTVQRQLVDGGKHGLIDNSTTDIVEHGDSTLFISSFYSGICIRNGISGKCSYLNKNFNSEARLSSDNVGNLRLINENTLAIAYRKGGIDFYDIKQQQTNSIEELAGKNMISAAVNTTCVDPEGGLWIGTKSGLTYFNYKTSRLENFNFQDKKSNFIIDKDIISLHADREGLLWIGSRNNGLAVVSRKDILTQGQAAKFAHYHPAKGQGALSYRSVLSIFRDKDGHAWIGTHGGGLNYAVNRSKRFSILRNEPWSKTSLSYNKVWGITEDTEGNIWVGTDGNGVDVWNPKRGIIKSYQHNPNNPTSLSDNAVISAFTDHKGNVWLGTYQGGLNRYEKATDSFIHYGKAKGLPKNDIRCFYEDDKQTLWVGMNQGGLAYYNPEEDRFIAVRKLLGHDIRSIQGNSKQLWLGTFGNGLLSYKPETQELEYNFRKDKNGFKELTVAFFSLCQTSDSILWLGTRYGGLRKFNTSTKQLTVYDITKGLSNNNVLAILPDEKGNLWLSTNKGISRFNPEKELFSNFGESAGVQAEGFHNGSALIMQDGTMCFGGINGMNYFNPKQIPAEQSPSEVIFTGLKIFNEDVLPTSDGLIETGIEYKPKLNLNYKQSVVTFEFQSVKYPFIDGVEYAYQLKGYDRTWNSTGQQNSVTYRNLPAGNYVFKVKSISPNSKAESKPTSLKISVSPPFWKSTWAYISYLLLVVSLVVGIFRYRINRYKIKNRLKYEQKLRTKEQKLHSERMEFFTNVSHELRTPLTILSVAIEELASFINNSAKAKKTLESATKNTNRMMEMVNRLLEFRELEMGKAKLQVRKLALNSFIPEFLQSFKGMAAHHNIDLKLMLPINELELWLDPDKFSTILNNLLSNAFKYTQSGGHIILSAEEQDTSIQIMVEDNGSGIPQQIQGKIFNRYFKSENKSTSTGIGLALTKSLVELHQGTIDVESSTGKGARFILKFKKGNEHFTVQDFASSEEPPIAKEPDTFNEEQEQETGKPIMLLVDDNQEIVDLLEDKFQEEFTILRAYDGVEGVQQARKHSPDLIISDIMMPNKSGTELCQELKANQETSHIPIILLTAKGTEQDEIKGLNTGADDYVSKPFRISILKARVRTLIDNRMKLQHYFQQSPVVKSINEPEKVGQPDPKQDKELAFIQKLEAQILENCLNAEISVVDLASKMGFSRPTLYRKVKSLTGLSINAFMRSVKLKRSAELIAQGANVSEAAYATGFNDLAHFRESFKKQYGKNPSEFKNG